jgi:hypothetical protein
VIEVAVIKIDDRTQRLIRTMADSLSMTKIGYLRQLLEREYSEFLEQKKKKNAG